MPSRKREISGRLMRICQSWPKDDDITATVIAKFFADGETITAKGELTEGQMHYGLTYRLYGSWKTHNRYGEQFVFDTFVEETPAEREAITLYLQTCDGIGPKTAKLIWDRYGEQSVEMVREQPDAVAAVIPRVSAQAMQNASAKLKNLQATERSKMDLLSLFEGKKLPKNLVDKCIAAWGSRAAEFIRTNPYLLMNFRGVGFLKTDALWLSLGRSRAKLKRQTLCIWHAIAKQSSGDTWFPVHVAKTALAQNVSGAAVRFEDAIKLGLRGGVLSERVDEHGQRWIAERKRADSEAELADLIEEARCDLGTTNMEWPSPDGLDVSDHQREQLRQALTGFISILAGSPGTGKTYAAAALIKSIITIHGENQVAVCAPTGKAAVRVSEAMAKAGIGLTASTIHSLLVINSYGDGWGFEHGRECPLPYKFIICDESSMIDTDLARSLLSARARGTHVLLIGDPNQLAPVGHGAPLRDMLAAAVPSGSLIEIQRNSGRIVRTCAEIRDHGHFQASAKIDLAAGENLIHIERHSPEQQLETLAAIYTKFQSPGAVTDPIWDIQTVCAVNKKSPLGRKDLNTQLQTLVNATGDRVSGSPFKVGDKIINTKNGWFPAVFEQPTGPVPFDPFETDPFNPLADSRPAKTQGSQEKHYVANGEQAEVLAIDPAKTFARLTAPDRTIVIPRAAKSDDEGDDSREEGDGSESDTGTGCTWELGYAISCHKSQGSEWPIVVVLIDEHPRARRVCTKQWLFTAISRAKSWCVTIGKRTVLDEMILRDGLFSRKTFLAEQIRELRQSSVDAEELLRINELCELALGGVC